MQTMNRLNRREHDRVRLNPMYTSIIVEPKHAHSMSMLGHAYDLSESGIRIELDEPLSVGENVTIHLDVPGAGTDILADADVVWVNDELDDPGPRRMALRFTDFPTSADRIRLSRIISQNRRKLAA